METRIIDNETMMETVRQFILEGRTVEIRCKGNSMNPFIVSGRDTIMLRPFNASELVPGAVILGRDRYKRYIIHRVAERHEDHVILNGDGNLVTMTERIALDDVIALADSFVVNGRRVSVESRRWRTYSFLWKLLSKPAVGSWSARRIYLGIWRRLHPSYILHVS